MTEFCMICSMEENDMCILPCSHHFGKDCLNKYILESVLQKGGDLPRCPSVSCEEYISKETIKTVLTTANYERYLEIVNNFEISKSPNKRFCPQNECGKVCTIKNNICICQCGFQFCAQCSAQYKVPHSCSDENCRLRHELGNNISKDIMKCPKCHALVCKVEGCNLMKCFCNYKFCHACGGRYSNTHYSGLFKCQGIYSEISISQFLLLNIAALIFFPISIIIVYIIMSMDIAKKKLPNSTIKSRRIGILIGFVCIIVVMFPVAYAIGILPYFVLIAIRVVVFARRLNKRKRLLV